ncbi:DMT family transporter [Rossellomorea sp. RS05]|uniref:DMT family transporter n=1 Tax=Rossellomorea sp. RS05 TaxID=3149166 RepID=UPI003221696A
MDCLNAFSNMEDPFTDRLLIHLRDADSYFLIPVVLNVHVDMLKAPLLAWLSLFYLGVISQFLAYVAWYGGMSLGGIAKVGQIQYAQPFFMIGFSFLFLGEPVTWWTIAFAVIVVLCVTIGKDAPVKGVKPRSS